MPNTFGIEQRRCFCDCGFLHRADQAHAGVVDEYVDAPAPGDDGLDAASNGRFVADIHRDELDIRYWSGFRDIAYGAEDLTAPLGKLLGGDTSDAR